MMNKLYIYCLLLIILIGNVYSNERTAPLTIDHTCTDLGLISMEWVDSVQSNFRMYYGHTSHGEQLTIGLERIESNNPDFNCAVGYVHLPDESDAFCIYDHPGRTPQGYWLNSGCYYTRKTFEENPTINITMWSWCSELNNYSEEQVQAYIDSISILEKEYPNIPFVYMTGHAQVTGSYGYNRNLRNEKIRQYCITNNKILFDFADLDSWWYNSNQGIWEQATYEYDGKNIPMEHPNYNGDDGGHTSFASCEQKGKAFWWMMAKLAGWADNTNVSDNRPIILENGYLNLNYPNPFNSSTTISYNISKSSNVVLKILNLMGQEINTLVDTFQTAGKKNIIWDGRDNFNIVVSSGIYICSIEVNNHIETRKMVLLK